MLHGFIFVACLILSGLAASALGPVSNAEIERIHLNASDLIVEVHKTHAHPFLAEYDSRLVLKGGSDELDAVDMNSDTEGRSRIDVLRIDPSTVAFRDHAKAVCLNIASEKFEDCTVRPLGKRIGFFDFDSSKKWRFVRRDEGRN